MARGVYAGEQIDFSEVDCTPDELLKPLTKTVFERNKNPLIIFPHDQKTWGKECYWGDVSLFEGQQRVTDHEEVGIEQWREGIYIRKGLLNYDRKVSSENSETDLSEPIPLYWISRQNHFYDDENEEVE